MKIAKTLCAPSINTLIHLNSINMYVTTQETLSKKKIYSYKLSKSFLIDWLTHKYRKILNSHLFWLNSHPGRACLVLRACRFAAFLDHDAKKGCEFNPKRCEFKSFLNIFKLNKHVCKNSRDTILWKKIVFTETIIVLCMHSWTH